MLGSRRSLMVLSSSALLVLLVLFSATAAQGESCPPGCKCHWVDNQFIVKCSGSATSVPPTSAPTSRPGATKTPNPRETDTTPQPTPEGTPTSSGNYMVENCAALPPGSYGLNCPGNLYDVVYACAPDYSFCWFVSVSCASCVAPTPQPPPTVNPLPCADVNFTQTGIQCTVGWSTEVSAKIPPVGVSYTPFPRGIVYDALHFTLAALVTQAWQCSDTVDGWDPINWAPSPDYRNLVFCLRWREVKNPEPAEDPAPSWAYWIWDERPWGAPPSTLSQQQTADHTYVTSSAQKTANGVGNLGAYQVQVHTYWVVEWKESWEHATHSCAYTGNDTDVCDGQSGYARTTEWNSAGRKGTADLREYGSPHFWDDSTLIRTPWGKEMNVLPVPVIEVQGVIEKP